MKKFFSLLVFALTIINTYSQHIPEGYLLQYHQDFSNKTSIQDFRISIPGISLIGTEKGNYFLEITAHTDTTTPPYQPSTICLLDNFIFGEYVMEATIMLTGESEIQPLWFLTGIKDSLNYYCLNISQVAGVDSIHGYAILRGEPREINIKINSPVSLKPDKWYKVRIERDIINPAVKIFIGDLKTPVMEINDRTFIMGYIGFGISSGSVRIGNINIWSQTSFPQPAGFFSK